MCAGMEHKNMSGTKRVNAAGPVEGGEGALSTRRRLDVARFPLRVASRYNDACCYLHGRTLHVSCAALRGTVVLPARLNLASPVLGLLGTERAIEHEEEVAHMTHEVLKHFVEPFLTAADLFALNLALAGLALDVPLSVDGTVLHECVALRKPCYCHDRRCPTHWTYTLNTGNRCRCPVAPWEARDAVAVFNVASGELRIDSPSMREFWLSVRLPLRMRVRADGVSELKTLTQVEYTCH